MKQLFFLPSMIPLRNLPIETIGMGWVVGGAVTASCLPWVRLCSLGSPACPGGHRAAPNVSGAVATVHLSLLSPWQNGGVFVMMPEAGKCSCNQKGSSMD